MSFLSQVLGIVGICFALGGVIYFLSQIHKPTTGWERTRLRLMAIACIGIGIALQALSYSLQ